MIHCILLASGFGRRFGSNKLLAEVDGKPLYRHTLELLLSLEDVTVTVVSRYPEIEAEAARLGARVIHNPDAEEGIAASIRYGVAAAPEADWYGFFVADQPLLSQKAVKQFILTAVESGKTLASVMSGGVPGNPTLFHHCWQTALLALQGDQGGRRILRAHPEEVFWFGMDPMELKDVDLQSDLPNDKLK